MNKTIDNLFNNIFVHLNNYLNNTFGHYCFKITSQEYVKYFTEI